MIEVKGLEELQMKLKSLQNIEKKTKPLMQTLGNILQNEIEASFENESSPFGQKWQALKPSTIRQKQKLGKSSNILRSDGNLADKWIVKADDKKATVSNNTNKNGFAYGLVHQFGTNKAGRSKNVRIAARPFLPVDKSGHLPNRTKQAIEDATIEFIINKLK
ncbi:phage virion morphogenesis protein [Campylobacter concisus]|jgi:phage virion morphogenesis protein|uniref:Phage virion morphogenesis protein n=1 Tax=Campylobacter concisus TaxID=199 RepID=A0A1Y5MVD8_9BACT|nr:phage virion morphogenesis protein [Campylobacter concisus]OUT12556.1 phage virion morphogenesis protein [Campylobacter concisus]DAF04798.1 MAG TPA: virion morphogenesis protein [Caudoviricetes sp.]